MKTTIKPDNYKRFETGEFCSGDFIDILQDITDTVKMDIRY